MEYEDRLTIHTPEGVDLSLSLAGIGSRCAAAIIDLTIQGALIAAATVLANAVAPRGGGALLAFAVVTVTAFLVVFAYDVACEVLGGGRTPGKRVVHLRVVMASGAPIGLQSSAVRNLLRAVDLLPGVYMVGLVSILVTPRNQRLGDLAAATVVVHEPRRPAPRAPPRMALPDAPGAVPPQSWDVSAVSADDLATLRSFLARRESLAGPAREQLATDLAARLRAKVVGAEPDTDDDEFLASLAEIKAARG